MGSVRADADDFRTPRPSEDSRDEIARLRREAADLQRALAERSGEAESLRRLHEFSTQMAAVDGLQPLLDEVLGAMVALHGADFGLIQMIDPASGDLVIVARHRLPTGLLPYFDGVDDESSASSRALTRGIRVVIDDVTTDADFAPHRAIAASAGFRTVQSTPLVSYTGETLGVISTQFREPHRFSASVLRITDLYARHAAHLLERHRGEQALGASEARFRRCFDLGLVGMALTSPSKGCLEVNDEMCRILGYSRAELLSKHWPDLTHPEDLAADIAQFAQVLSGAQDGYVIDKRFIRKDGRVVFTTMATNCLRARDGSIDCFVALVLDVSDLMHANEALRRTRDQLVHMGRVAAMGELATSIAHEMNQPLAAVVANGNASRHWLAAMPPNLGEALAAVDRIVADGRRAAQVIARIRAFVRRSDTQRASIDLQEVLRDVAAIVENEARTRGVALHVEVGAWPAPVIGDRVQLQQVVLHLVINAIEAMATTPVERRRLVIRLDRDGPDTMRVSVRDAGLGLPAQDRDRVFEAFYTTKDNGMGMGLAISRSIIEAHEGRLWCAPNDEGGESFCFTLPT